MAKKNAGKSYEELVKEVYQAILDYENADAGYKRIEVQHNVQLKGKTGNLHQIDVFWTFKIGGIEYKTLVEVKDWKSPVKKEQLHSFKSVLDDIPGSPRGCFVSKGGFQSGAVKTAQHHGISLVVIDKECSSFKILLNDIVTYYDCTSLSVDEYWVKKEKISYSELERFNHSMDQEDVMLLNPANMKVRLYDLMCNSARPFYFEKDGVRHIIEKKLNGSWFWLTGNAKIPQIKVEKYEFQCYNKCTRSMIEINIPHYVITDILEQKKHVYCFATREIELSIP